MTRRKSPVLALSAGALYAARCATRQTQLAIGRACDAREELRVARELSAQAVKRARTMR